MYDVSFEEWIECEEYYNEEIDYFMDEEAAIAMADYFRDEEPAIVMTDDEFIEWCEERNYASFEEMCEWYDTLGF